MNNLRINGFVDEYLGERENVIAAVLEVAVLISSF